MRRARSWRGPGLLKISFLGKLDVDEPNGLSYRLEEVCAALLSDPYLKGVPQCGPAEDEEPLRTM